VQDILFGNISLSVGALLISLFGGWQWGAKAAIEERDGVSLGGVWSVLIRFACPVAVAAVLVSYVAGLFTA
jgi:NSS family neurotransmitter:Na+ symporter